jgi:hypothetical protein
VNCARVQEALSERMDGEHLSPRVRDAVDSHVESCLTCHSFLARAERVRRSVRMRPAEDVPDLTERIMEAVETGSAAVLTRRRRPAPVRRRARPAWGWAPVAAALVVGLVAGSIAVGGPWQTETTRPTALAQVARGVRSAARGVDSYHATFQLSEHGLPGAPDRAFAMEVWFAAPQRFRLELADRTSYPSDAWTPTEITYVADGTATYLRAPTGCPATLGAACPATREVLEDQSAFSTATTIPSDLVLPLDVFGSTRGIAVAGSGTALGRPAVRLTMSFDRAAPLFPFLRLGGTWRPFFGGDAVEVWLDGETYFPLRWRVTASIDPDRRDWELRFGLPAEPAGGGLLDVRATSFDTVPPPATTFSIAGLVPPVVDPAELAAHVGFEPVTPIDTKELAFASAAVAPPTATEDAPQTLLTYADGLAYLKVGERRDWEQRRLFGPLTGTPEVVDLENGGVAYYEPATADHGRRLAIHTDETDLYLETNLPREELLSIAATLPPGRRIPAAWWSTKARDALVRLVSLEDAGRLVPFRIRLPGSLPEGYAFAAAQVTRIDRSVSVAIVFRRLDSDLAGQPITLHVERARAVPPTTGEQQVLVDVGGRPGRYTPASARLEWLSGRLLVTIEAPGMSLRDVLAIALSIPGGRP